MKFRPHHFLCTLGFEGKGYSPSFVENYSEIADRLRAPDGSGDPVEIEVVPDADGICEPCPQRRGTSCTQIGTIRKLDEAHAKVLGLKPGDRVSWGEAKRRIVREFTDEKFNEACAPCGWKELGVCEKALRELRHARGAVALALMLSASAVAAKPGADAKAATGSTGTPVVDLFEARPADELLAGLVKDPKKARAGAVGALVRAIDAAARGKFELARKEAASAARDPLFAGVAAVVGGEVSLSEAEKLLGQGKAGPAVRAADRAARSLADALVTDPDRRIADRAKAGIARADMVAAGGLLGQPARRKDALRRYGMAFERLKASDFRMMAREGELEAYATACAKAKEGECAAWIREILGRYPAGSREAKAVLKGYPEAAGFPTAPLAEKLTRAYREADPDFRAIDEAMGDVFEGNYGDAAEKFSEHLKKYPQSSQRHRARFWLGRVLELNGDKEEARPHYLQVVADSPLSYYGLIAAWSAGIAPSSALNAEVPLAARRDPFLTPAEARAVDRAERFLAAGARGLARWELQGVKPGPDLSGPFLVYLAALDHRAGAHEASFWVLDELFDRGYLPIRSSYGLRLIFPADIMEPVRRLAADAGVDPTLVLSLIKQESAFKADAVSGSGAVGLMQIMPATAVDQDAAVAQSSLDDPDANIRVGAGYLGKLISRFWGSIIHAVAAYNAGPTRVQRWIREVRPGAVGPLEFIESIPYKETREYVGSVIRNYYWYSNRLDGKQIASLDPFWVAVRANDLGADPALIGVSAPTGPEPGALAVPPSGGKPPAHGVIAPSVVAPSDSAPTDQ